MHLPQAASFATPSLLAPRPVLVWVIIGLFAVYLCVGFGFLFETVAPVAEFPFRPAVSVDSDTYWALAGLKEDNQISESVKAGGGTLVYISGPVIEAALLRTDFNVMVCNCLLFASCLWLLRGRPGFDRATFLLLMMANPLLMSSLVSLNKEIFALAGVVYFVAYATAEKHRIPLLSAALLLSFMARWQQAAVLLLFLMLESRLSPLRGRRRAGLIVTLLAFTVGYAVVNQLFPFFFAALIAQAESGRTVALLARVQGNFGFPLVVIPKILMDCMGHLITPWYFFGDYFREDFRDWHSQIFLNVHTLAITALLLVLLFTRKLRLQSPVTYLLGLYLLMIAVSPMVQPRYEYPAYVLLCLEASRYWRLHAPSTAGLTQQTA